METQPPAEEFIGSDLQPQPDAPRPKTTPYATSPVALRIGPQETQYYVPQRLLQNPQWIAINNSWGEEIELPDVDEGTGHVLIHYLYTGAYQTLDDIELSPVEAVHVEFRRAVIAYIAAKKYMLHGLQRLAGQQISTFGAEMSIFDVVEAINKDFSRIPDDATWFHNYMSDKVRTAFEQDQNVFVKYDLFSRIDNVALIKVLVKVMVEVYSTELSIVLCKKENSVLANAEERVARTEDLLSDEPLQVQRVNTNEAPSEECPAEVSTNEEIAIKEAPAQEAFVQASPETGTVSVNDGPAVSPSKTPKKKGKKSLATFTTSAVAEPKAMPIVKKKKKKEPGTSVEALLAEIEPTPQPVLEAEPAVVKEDDALPDLGAPPPIKKKKGKKQAIVGMEAVIKAEETQPLPVEYPTPVEGEYPDEKPVIEEPLLSHPLENVREPEPEPVAKKMKKSKKASILSPPPVLEPEPTPGPVLQVEPVPEVEPMLEAAPVLDAVPVPESKLVAGDELGVPEQDDSLAVQSTSSLGKKKAKKGKKGKAAAVIEGLPSPPPEPVPEPEPAVEELSQPAAEEPGLELVEHDKDYNEEVPALPPAIPILVTEPEPAPIEGPEWGLDSIWGAAKKKKKAKKGKPLPEPEPPIESQDPQDLEPTFTIAMAAESAPVEEISTAQTNELDPLSSNSPVSPPLEPESPIEADIGYCPRRAKHIGKSDRWKTCEQCRTFLRQIAVEFARTGSPIETGYEIVEPSSNVL